MPLYGTTYNLFCSNDGTSITLDIAPIGWNDRGHVLKDNDVYYGRFSEFTLDEIGFVSDEKSKIGGKNYILSKIDTYGILANITLTIIIRDPSTNHSLEALQAKLSLTESPNRKSNETERDTFYCKLIDSSGKQRFRNNDELDYEIQPDKSITLTKQNLYSRLYATQLTSRANAVIPNGYDPGSDAFSDFEDTGVPYLLPLGEIVTDNISDDDLSIFDGAESIIYQNDNKSVSSNLDITFTPIESGLYPGADLVSIVSFTGSGEEIVYRVITQMLLVVYDSNDSVVNTTNVVSTSQTESAAGTTGLYEETFLFNYNNTEYTLSVPPSGYVKLTTYVQIRLYDNGSGYGIDFANGGSYGIVSNQFDINILQDFDFDDTTPCKVILPQEAFTLVCARMGVSFDSDIFNRTDLGATTDGELSLIALSNGFNIRQFPDEYENISLQFRKLFKAYNSIRPLQVIFDGNFLRIEERENKYSDELIYDFGVVSNVTKTYDSSLYFNQIKAGQSNKLDNQTVNGGQEACTNVSFGTVFEIKNTYDIQSSYRTDPTGIEVSRRLQYVTSGDKDNKNDSDVFLIEVERDNGSYISKRKASGDEIYNILNGDTRLNLGLLPSRSIRKHGAFILPMFYKTSSSILEFLSSQLNSDIGVKFSGESNIIYENSDIDISELGSDVYYSNEIYEFEYPMTYELRSAIFASNGYITINAFGNNVNLYIIEVESEDYNRTATWRCILKSE